MFPLLTIDYTRFFDDCDWKPEYINAPKLATVVSVEVLYAGTLNCAGQLNMVMSVYDSAVDRRVSMSMRSV